MIEEERDLLAKPDIYRFSLQTPKRVFDNRFVTLDDYKKLYDLYEELNNRSSV